MVSHARGGRTRILVTGATSFIGSNLVRRLNSLKKYKINALASPSNALTSIKDICPALKIWRGDICDFKFVNKVIKKTQPQIIYHLAGYGVHAGQRDLINLVKVNVLGLSNLVTALQNTNFERLIHSGTSAEYGPSLKPMHEAQALDPATFYGATKAASSLIVRVFGKMNPGKIIILRPFYVYGADEGDDRFVTTAIKACIAGKTLPLTSYNEKRDFIYIDDVVDAYICAMKSKIRNYSIVNVGTGVESSLRNIIKLIEKKIGKKIKVKEGGYPHRPWRSNCWAANTNQTVKLLGWKPRYDLESGISKVVYEIFDNASPKS